jgi:hypothetical protein
MIPTISIDDGPVNEPAIGPAMGTRYRHFLLFIAPTGVSSIPLVHFVPFTTQMNANKKWKFHGKYGGSTEVSGWKIHYPATGAARRLMKVSIRPLHF